MNRRTLLSVLASGWWPLRLEKINLFGSRDSMSSDGLVLRKFRIPMYPKVARQLGFMGKTTAKAHIGADGRVTSVSDVVGHPAFYSAVVDALMEWHFEGTNGRAGELQIEFVFTLKGDDSEKCLNYSVFGTLPDHFEIETNPSREASASQE